MYNLNPVVTKEFILDNLDQVQILEYYLGVKVQKKKVRSPLRMDNNPSCSFSANGNGVIYFKDWAQGFTGDWIKVIQYKYGLTYQQALDRCAEDFQLVRIGMRPAVPVTRDYTKIQIEPTESVIQIKIRPWDVADREYWSTYGINRGTLELYNVFPCEIVFYNSKIVYSRTKNDLAYAYRFSPGKYKIYIPQRSSFRWLSNFTSWQGLEQLPSTGDCVVITKSMKDVMCLRQFGVHACSPASEVAEPEEKILADLSSRFTDVVTLMDFDYTGIKMANKLYKQYNFQPLFLTNGRFGTYNYKAKDISDFYEMYGHEHTQALINESLITLNKKNGK